MLLEHDPDTGGRLHIDWFTAVVDDDDNVIEVVVGGGEVMSDVMIKVVVDVISDVGDDDFMTFWQKS